jgi:hypothetical protein
MYDIPFDRSFLQLSNGIRHVMPSTDTKPKLTAKASMAQPISQPAVYANGLINIHQENGVINAIKGDDRTSVLRVGWVNAQRCLETGGGEEKEIH